LKKQLLLLADSDLEYRLGINPQANQKPNPLKRFEKESFTLAEGVSRFEGLAAWELIPRQNGSSR
jgi:hypothetical protein